MAIYGTPLTMGGGGGGQNETLPPLLDNFKATRLEGGIVPPTANTLAFKDIPDGAKIKLVKGGKISGTVTYGTTTDLNHRIVFDSNDWTKKEFRLENDSSHNNISGSDIDQWLNATKASGWWTNQSTNTTSPDYANEQGFLYQLGVTDELLTQNFNDININATAKAKVGLPWRVSFSEDIPYTFFKDVTMFDFADYASLYGDLGNDVLKYNKPQTKAPSQITLYNVTAKIHPMMEPKPDTKVALDADGSYFMFEKQTSIILSADKMPVSRANALAGAVWVYGDHIPQNKNDGTKIELTRDEVINPDAAQTFATGKTIADLLSKSKVKLGRYGDADLQWLVSRNAENKLILVLDSNSISALGNKILDAAEPSNSDSDRRNYGNNRYIYTNLHQWLNAEKGANQWFVKAHTYDVPPDYTNVAGFLNGWKKEELDLLELAEWTVTKTSVDGGGTETFQSKVVLPSTTEMGFSTEGGGSKLDIFNSDSDRQTGSTYWTRTPSPTFPCINYQVKSDGTQYSGGYNSYNGAIRPICSIPETTLVSDTPDSDGCYTFIFTPPLERTVVWDKSKNFYARQFTYNSKKQYQTMLEGATAYLPIMPDGQELSKLPSKSKIKLGKVNNTVLKWIVCRDTSDNQVRLILDGSSYNVLGEKQFDAPEPSNSDSGRRSFGNNRYIWSNLHQWLNSNKPANQWYTSQHGADAPPNYANQNGFLNQWTEKEIKSLEFANWTVTKSSVDGSGSETFRSRVTLASTTELGLESGTGGGRLDIMNSNADRDLGTFYWCRTPYPSSAFSVRGVGGGGALGSLNAYSASGVRPLCIPVSNTLVSIETDSEGCYTLV